jgi:hypothetical protein
MKEMCFLTDVECDVVDFLHDGLVYKISESIADESPVKVIKNMIVDKIESNKSKKTGLLTRIEDMAKSMGVSKDELIKMLGGGINNSNNSQPQQVKQQINIKKNDEDDGFKEVDGSLKSSAAKVSVDRDSGDYIAPSLPAYNSVKDKDGKQVVESDKKVKTVDNIIISKSSMGTTTIAISPTNSENVNKLISEVDRRTNELIRGNATGDRNQAKECPLCKGTGITQINKKVCTKCNGSGFIFL